MEDEIKVDVKEAAWVHEAHGRRMKWKRAYKDTDFVQPRL